MESNGNNYEQSIWRNYLLKIKKIEEKAEKETSIDETDIKMIVQLLEKLHNTNLKEEELEEIIEEALTIETDFQKGNIFVSVAEYPQTSPELIREIRELISNEIDDKYKRKIFLDEIDIYIEEIVEQSLEKLDDVNLKEKELKRIVQIVSLIKDDFTKSEILVKVARHPQASMEVIETAKLYVSEIEIQLIQKKCLKKIRSICTDEMIIKYLLDNLNNLNFKETELDAPEEIIESVLKGKTDYQKGEILIKVAEYPQTSIWAVKEIMWQYYSGKIKNNDIIEENLSRLHKILDRKEEESGIKSQQIQLLKQCEGELRNLSTLKNIKSNSKQ